MLENIDDVVLLQAVFIIKHGGDKFIKTDFAIFVHVYAFEDGVQLFAIDGQSLMPQGFLYFINS